MPVDYPDNFGQPQFPRLGAAKRESDEINVVASVETTIITVTGRGVIYGGAVRIDGAISEKNSTVRLYIDGTPIISSEPEGDRIWGEWEGDHVPVWVTYYDNLEFVYSHGIMGGLSFESSVAIKYNEAHGGTPKVGAELYYAFIQ